MIKWVILKRPLDAFLLLAAVHVLSFGIFTPRVGFYHDDWTLLELWSKNRGLLAFASAFYKAGFGVRPLDLPQFWLLFSLGGMKPLPYQLFLCAADVAQAFLFYLLAERLTGARPLALAAGVCAAMFPSHTATHFWLSSSGQTTAISLVLASLLCHLRWLETRRLGLLAASLGLYALGLSAYESPAFLPLLLAAPVLDKPREAARRMAPYLAPFAVVMLWQRFLFPRSLGTGPARASGFSARHFFESFRSGLGCASWKIIALCGKTLPAAWRDLGGFAVAASATLAAGLAWALARRWKRDPRAARLSLRLAGAAFLAANIPYALTRDYMPTYNGVMSRTSALGGLAAALLVAAALCALKPRLAGALAFVLAAGFTWTNWHTSSQWVASWRMQRDILGKAAPGAAASPAKALLLIDGFQAEINSRLNEVVVFDAAWDISSALRLETGREDLEADVVTPRLSFEKDAITVLIDRTPTRISRYDNVFVYHYDQDRWARASPPR